MRSREFIADWTVNDDALIDMFECWSVYLKEGANKIELNRLNEFLIGSQEVSKPRIGDDYYPVSFNALLTTVDPSTPALITISRFKNNKSLQELTSDSYIFDGLKFDDIGINGGFLKKTVLFKSEQEWNEFLTLFLLGFSNNEWKIREKIL